MIMPYGTNIGGIEPVEIGKMSDFIFYGQTGKRANRFNPYHVSILRRLKTKLLGVRCIFEIGSSYNGGANTAGSQRFFRRREPAGNLDAFVLKNWTEFIRFIKAAP
jgi:hypothetical protein